MSTNLYILPRWYIKCKSHMDYVWHIWKHESIDERSIWSHRDHNWMVPNRNINKNKRREYYIPISRGSWVSDCLKFNFCRCKSQSPFLNMPSTNFLIDYKPASMAKLYIFLKSVVVTRFINRLSKENTKVT
jgi:hypothetical protein